MNKSEPGPLTISVETRQAMNVKSQFSVQLYAAYINEFKMVAVLTSFFLD